MRRFTRLTNTFSKTSRTTVTWSRSAQFATTSFGFTRRSESRPPAMESGIVDHLSSFEDSVGIVAD